MKTLITSASLAIAVSFLSPHALADKTPLMKAEDACSAIGTFVTDLRRLPSDDMIQGTNLDESMKDKITNISHDATEAYLDQLREPIFLMDSILEEHQDDTDVASYMESESCKDYHFLKNEYEKWGDNVPSTPDTEMANAKCLGVSFSKDGVEDVGKDESTASLPYAYFMYLKYSNEYLEYATSDSSCDALNAYRN